MKSKEVIFMSKIGKGSVPKADLIPKGGELLSAKVGELEGVEIPKAKMGSLEMLKAHKAMGIGNIPTAKTMGEMPVPKAMEYEPSPVPKTKPYSPIRNYLKKGY